MNDSTRKTRQARNGATKPATARAGSSAPPPPLPADGPDGVPAATLASVAPKGAVKENSAAVVSTTATTPPGETAGKPVTKTRKPKLVRAAFELPEDEYAALGTLKKACQDKGLPVKKRQLLRVAIALLRNLDEARLAPMIAALPPAKRAGGRKAR